MCSGHASFWPSAAGKFTILLKAVAICVLSSGCATTPAATSEAVMSRAGQLYARHELESAAQVLRQGLKRFPNDAQLHFMLGNAYFRQKRWTNSISEYVQASALRPDHVDTFLCLGFAL
jgi:cytochrome c-type biogenesis protein CcmH/NrfG